MSRKATSWLLPCSLTTMALCLEVVFKDVRKGVYIQIRPDANIFKVFQCKSKTRTTRSFFREILFAVDSALVAHYAEDMHGLVDCFACAALHLSLKMKIKKMECLYQPVRITHPPPNPIKIAINKEPLVQCTDFRYLGSAVFNNGRSEK